ncbi:hypothetical protein CANARDRAFT_5042 [[Candida] arabinofermentans NRRL YB-2248]|uniref:Condensin complex subunit 2 n=1 Tax=[Candida] arabinofermentans NRRL YB-2248 TaxID=983967 RepID=A0A1E4T7U8_9ASCO|nr:hypothetical protein CANARDRAFT_5042 [[Candida] arabinofermentans NRRL YB-2248]
MNVTVQKAAIPSSVTTENNYTRLHSTAVIPRKRLLDEDDRDEDVYPGDGELYRQLEVDAANRETHQSNFDQAIKLATDNKINSNNTWNIALIDYFHDMNLLKSIDGSSINFQKAGATLDGCVKVWTHRIDSVASETGKLLSGLGTKKDRANAAEEDESDIDSDEDYTQTKTRKRAKARPRVNIKESFDSSFQLKQFEKELNIDPVFKKTLADFDEGGAKSLLLNSLSQDVTGRIVFDDSVTSTCVGSADGAVDGSDIAQKELTTDAEKNETNKNLSLKIAYMKNPCEGIDDLMVSSGLRQVQAVLFDFQDATTKEFVENLLHQDADNVFDRDISGMVDQIGHDDNFEVFGSDMNNNDFNDDMDGPATPKLFEDQEGDRDGEVDDEEEEEEEKEDDDGEESDGGVLNRKVLSYFDNNTNKAWRGPLHWKVNLIQKSYAENQFSEARLKAKKSQASELENQDEVKKEDVETQDIKLIVKSNNFKVNFLSDDEDETEDQLFKPGNSRAMDIAKSSRSAKSSSTLPDDYHWSSEKLIKSFLRPNEELQLFQRRKKLKKTKEATPVVDEEFFAQNYGGQNPENGLDHDFSINHDNDDPLQLPSESQTQSAPMDDEYDDYEFSAVDFDSQPASKTLYAQRKESQLKYAKTAKKVDVGLLKSRLWESTVGRSAVQMRESHMDADVADPLKIDVRLVDVAKDVGSKYEGGRRRDLSTSFIFICMLHLANEHDLVIESNEDYTDLTITGVAG